MASRLVLYLSLSAVLARCAQCTLSPETPAEALLTSRFYTLADLPSMDTNCELMESCNVSRGDAVIADLAAFRDRFLHFFGDCHTWAAGMKQEHCETFVQYAMLSVRRDKLGTACLTPEAFDRILTVMVTLFKPGPNTLTKPDDYILQRTMPPSEVVELDGDGIVASRLATATRYRMPKGVSVQQYLSRCPTFPMYSSGTVAYPTCARAICAAYGQMPHTRAPMMETCCQKYELELGYWSEHFCWFHPLL